MKIITTGGNYPNPRIIVTPYGIAKLYVSPPVTKEKGEELLCENK